MNNITVHGNLGQQPELRFSPSSNVAVVTFSVVSNYGKDDKKKTMWFNVTAFGKLAENIAGSLGKGDTVLMTGRMEQEEYTSKEGDKRKAIKFIAEEVGASLRWNSVLKDNSKAVMAEVSERLGVTPFGEEPF